MKFIELSINNVSTLWVSKSSNIKMPEIFYPQSGYIKIDAYLLNPVSRISDVKCYTIFLFLNIVTFQSYDEHVPNTRIVQKTISKHQTEGATTSEAAVHRCS